MTRRFVADDEASAVLAALLLMSFYSVAYVLVSTNTDTAYNFFNIAGLFFLLDYFEKRRAASLALSAILEAFGCWSKYQAMMFIVVLGIVWLGFWLASATFLRKRRGDLTFPISGALVWGVGILAIFAPFMLRNFERFGNPVYPALPTVFGGRDVNDWTLSWLIARKQILPYVPNEITVSHATNLLFFAGAFLMPAALGYAAPRAKSAYSYLLASSVLFSVLWYRVLAAPETGDFFRFLIPALAAVSCLSAPLLARLLFDESEARPRLNLLVLLCLVNAALLFVDFGMYGFSSREFVFNVSEKLGMFGTFINYMLKYSKYHHFVIFLVGTGLLVGLSSLRGRPDYARAGRRYRRLVATLMALSLLLYPFVRFIGTANAAMHNGISLEVMRSSSLNPVVAAYLASRLPKDAKVLTFFTLKYLVPRTVVPGDGEAVREPVRGEVHGIFDTTSPQRKFYEGEARDQYTDADIRKALTVLKREGVTHILLDSIVDSQDVYWKSPIFTNVDHDPRYFKLRAWGSVAEGRFISLFEVAYPPDLDVRSS